MRNQRPKCPACISASIGERQKVGNGYQPHMTPCRGIQGIGGAPLAVTAAAPRLDPRLLDALVLPRSSGSRYFGLAKSGTRSPRPGCPGGLRSPEHPWFGAEVYRLRGSTRSHFASLRIALQMPRECQPSFPSRSKHRRCRLIWSVLAMSPIVTMLNGFYVNIAAPSGASARRPARGGHRACQSCRCCEPGRSGR